MTLRAPVDLRTNNELRPIAVGEPPRLSWAAIPGQVCAEVMVLDVHGHPVWNSGPIQTSAPQLNAAVALQSRQSYAWRVRVADRDRRWSPWSQQSQWECPLLHPEDWTAEWICRPVLAAQRISRSVARGRVDWAARGQSLAQSFLASGEVRAVSLDLTGQLDVDVHFTLELVDTDGRPVTARDVDGP